MADCVAAMFAVDGSVDTIALGWSTSFMYLLFAYGRQEGLNNSDFRCTGLTDDQGRHASHSSLVWQGFCICEVV